MTAKGHRYCTPSTLCTLPYVIRRTDTSLVIEVGKGRTLAKILLTCNGKVNLQHNLRNDL